MIVEPTYRSWRIEVNAIPANGRFNADVRLLRLYVKAEGRSGDD
jgi:hypothetical protein